MKPATETAHGALTVVFLGTGSSAGTPVIGCRCPLCSGNDPRNRRLRAAILVESGDVRLLIDAGPDLRQQMLREHVSSLDGVLFTHIHADHVNGIDDLRAFNFLQKAVIPCYGDAATVTELQNRFRYCFSPPDAGWSKPSLIAHTLTGRASFRHLQVTPVRVWHGWLPILGYRINGMAYLTDLKSIPEDSFRLLEELDLLVLDCLRYEPHPTHINVEEALGLAARIGAKRTFLTHMTHEIDYESLSRQLPPGVFVAYDGLRLSV